MHTFPSDNNLSINRLAACFNNTAATYKYYWQLAILEVRQDKRQEIGKLELFVRMISNAWYTVNYFHVSFGQQDLIQDTVRQLKDIEGITIDEQKASINLRLMSSDRPETRKLLFHFDKNVPHWFLSPWYPGMDKRTIYQLSHDNVDEPLYHLHKDKIVINDRWFSYLAKHIRIVRDYIYWNLSLFLQVRNPNVPDIPNKLIKPAMRNSLLKQRKFWDFVIDVNGPLICIYTGRSYSKANTMWSTLSHIALYHMIKYGI